MSNLLTLENLWVLLSLIVFCLLIIGVYLLESRLKLKFAYTVFSALGIGIAYGVSLQLIYGSETSSGAGQLIKKWINILGQGFTRSLQFLVVPLVLVSIIKAIAQFTDSTEGAKKAGKIIAFLLITTGVSSIITLTSVKISGVNADKLIDYSNTTSQPADVPTTLLDIFPSNLFHELSANDLLPVVFISAIIGFSYLRIKSNNEKAAALFKDLLETAHAFVMEIVDIVISLTPYGVLAIIAVRTASGSWTFIVQLGFIILIAYSALVIIFILHLAIAWLFGANPILYIKKVSPALIFAFSSRSSSATLPLTIKSMRSLGVSEINANLAGTLGTCIGQNACAGMHPTLVAILAGMRQKWDVWTFQFLIQLVIIVVIASIGTAGVGGGAINVSLLVLSLIGLPIDLVTILISVDFIIDMGRTLINVNDSILTGYVIGKFEKEINKEIFQGHAGYEELENQQP